jgi:hypothetical protein
VPAFFDEFETRARSGRRLEQSRRAGRNKRRKVRNQCGGEGVQRRHLVIVRTLDLALARLVHMVVIRMVMMMRIQMGMDDRSVYTIAMDMLKRRQYKGGYKRDTAMQRENPPHHQRRSPARASARTTIGQTFIELRLPPISL